MSRLVRPDTIGLVRIALVTFGALALVWAYEVLVSSPQPAGLERTAAKILRGEAFKSDDLDRLGPGIEAVETATSSRAASLRAVAVVELRQMETAIADGLRKTIDERSNALGRSLDRALAATPSDSFLWLVRFWRDNLADGFDPDRVSLLEFSYRLGPNEGWIGVRRSPMALALLPRLPEKLQAQVVTEFAALVESGFPETAQTLIGPGWPARDTLLAALETTSLVSRKALARRIYQLDYDVAVPGVPRPDARPWSR